MDPTKIITQLSEEQTEALIRVSILTTNSDEITSHITPVTFQKIQEGKLQAFPVWTKGGKLAGVFRFWSVTLVRILEK